MNTETIVQDYIEFQKHCASPFHVVAHLKERLLKLGFHEVSLTEPWKLESHKNYFVIHGSGKSIVSFRLSKNAPAQSGFAMIGAHTDSPVLRLKLNPWGNNVHGYQVLFNEAHGSLILRTWLDRPLILAGQVYTYKRDKNNKPVFSEQGVPIVESKMVSSSWPLAVIPDLAIHLDREKNNLGMINPETMMHAITGCEDKKGVKAAIQKALNCDELDGFELNFAPYFPHCRVGANQEFITGPRHDDLVMVYTAQRAMESIAKKECARTCVAAFFDSEETGSETSGGAASYFIEDVLKRIHEAHPHTNSKDALGQSFAKSFVISADVAHGLHPSYREKHDMNNKPVVNGGLVIKSNANDRYATSAYGVSLMRALCASVEAPVQDFCARGDIGCGSTIGPMISAKLSCETVDVGIAMWAMHSASETVGANDLVPTIHVFEKFYS